MFVIETCIYKSCISAEEALYANTTEIIDQRIVTNFCFCESL